MLLKRAHAWGVATPLEILDRLDAERAALVFATPKLVPPIFRILAHRALSSD
jgi:hypothetical protein